MKISTILLSIAAFILVALLFAIFVGLPPFGKLRSTSSVREIPAMTNAPQENPVTNANEQTEEVSDTSSALQPSRLLSPDAIRLETIDGKPCTIVELSKIEPTHDATAQEYRWIVDFGAFEEDDCVRMQTANEQFVKQNITLPETGQGWTRTGKIPGTTMWEHILHYGKNEPFAVQSSPLLSPDAIRLDTTNGKPCYIVELSKITPDHDPAAKAYRYVVDFGPFGDTCVRLSPPGPIDGKNTFAKEGNAAGRRIDDTTFREYIYHYEE